MKYVIVDFPNARTEILQKSGTLKFVKVPEKIQFKVEFDLNQNLFTQASKDPLLNQRKKDIAKDVYNKFTDEIAKVLKEKDKEAVTIGKADFDKFTRLLDAEIKIRTNNATWQATKECTNLWNELGQRNKEYKKYQVKVVCSIASSAASLAAGIATAATGGFTGGASTALGIIGIIKSSATLAREIGSAALEVEQSHVIIRKELDALKKIIGQPKTSGAKGVGALGTINEYGAGAAAALFGACGPSIKTCSERLEIAQKKIQGVEVKSHDLAKQLNELLEKQDKFQAEFMAKVPGIKLMTVKAKFEKYFQPTDEKIHHMIGKVTENYTRIEPSQKAQDAFKKKLEPLEEARKRKDFVVLDKILATSDIVTAVFGTPGDIGRSAQWFKDCAVSLEQVLPIYTWDKITDAVLG